MAASRASLLRAAGRILSVSLLINFFLRLFNLLLDVGRLFAVCLTLSGRRSRLLLRLLQLVGLHPLNSLQNVEELFLFGVKEASRARFIPLGIPIVHDTLSSLLVTLEQVQALVGHLMVNAIDLAGA